MFGWFKKKAVDVAGEYAKDYLTIDNITKWILDAINKLLAKAMGGVDDAKLKEICTTCDKVSVLCSTLSKALADKKIAEDEAEEIVKNIQDIIGTCGVDDKKIASYVDTLVAKIQEKL